MIYAPVLGLRVFSIHENVHGIQVEHIGHANSK